MKKENRIITLEAEVRLSEGDGKPAKIVGYAARFNSPSKTMKTESGKQFREVIAPGAFRTALAAGDDVLATTHHDPTNILGRSSKGTLEMREDENGLRIEITPPDTTFGRDTLEQVRRGDLDKMSFAFAKADDTWERDGDCYKRTINSIGKLYDVTLTPTPAYDSTSVDLRSADKAIVRVDSGEKRVSTQFEDTSVLWGCKWLISCCRNMMDACQSINEAIDALEKGTGELSELDKQAMNEAYDNVQDVVRKGRLTMHELQEAGAEDEDTQDDGGTGPVDDSAQDDAERSLLAKHAVACLNAGIKPSLAGFDKCSGQSA